MVVRFEVPLGFILLLAFCAPRVLVCGGVGAVGVVERSSMEAYDASIEQAMKTFYGTLSEKDKRRYAAIEALKLGHGGMVYIAQVLGCSRKTIAQGIQELRDLPVDGAYDPRIRAPGGGRKPYDARIEGIDDAFLEVLRDYTAGDPQDPQVLWTNLSPREIAHRLAEKHAIRVSVKVVRKLLRKHHYRRRKAQKKQTMKEVPQRNEQFEHIAQLKADYHQAGNPVISIDTKKKEMLGNYYREGRLYTQQVLCTYDHDFGSFVQGIVLPHGIYDLRQNTGYVTLGTSKDTSEFVCDSLRNWWIHQGRYDYPHGTSILILCDSGGSNHARQYLFKADLQNLADELGIELRIAHYPPYTSKYNPIEHRLFPHLTRACQGVILKSIELVQELMQKTKTSQGLTVTVQILDKIYQTGRKVTKDFKKNMRILFDDYLPQWNYRAVPIQSQNGTVI